MKNKHVKITEKDEHGNRGPIKRTPSFKSQEQLRKKLKLLLDKEGSKSRILTSDKKTSHIAPVSNYSHKTYTNANTLSEEKTVKSKAGNVTTSNNLSGSSKANKETPKNKAVSVSNKRKSVKKEGPVEKASKPSKHGQVTNTKSKTTTLKSHNTPVQKSEISCLDKAKSVPKKALKTTQQLNNKTNSNIKPVPRAHSENKIKKSSKKNSNTKNTKKKSKKQNIYKGPLRPSTSDSESNDTVGGSPATIQHSAAKEQNLFSKNQALTRISYSDEDSGDESYVIQSDDYSYNTDDSFSDDSGGTDVVTSDDYDLSSGSNTSFLDESLYYDTESDQTYELPENVCEDVYIAHGTAVKHDMSDNNEIGFDSDTSRVDDNVNESDDSCPQLVPVDFKAFTNDSGSECCSECFSTSSSIAEQERESSPDYPKMTPEIFQSNKTIKQDFDIDFFNVTNELASDCIAGSPLDRIANPNAKTNKYKVITTSNSTEHNKKETPCNIKSENGKLFLDNNSQEEIISSSDESSETSPDSIHCNGVTSDKELNKVEVKEPMPAAPRAMSTDKTLKNLPLESNFQTLFFNAINSNHVIVLLKDSLYIYGTVKLKLVAGSVEIFGYRPKPNEILDIFSPRGYSSIQIQPAKNSDNETFNEQELLSLTHFFTQLDLKEIVRKFDRKSDAIVILERNDRSKKVKMLKKYMVEHLFPNMNAIESNRPFYTSEFLLRCMIMLRNHKPLVIDPRWRTISVSSNSKVIVIGGKSVGKSTLVRYLINKNLNKYPKMLLIDLDIGQPEMFVPQTVSATIITEPLLGPGYFLNKEPDKAFIVGQTNVVFVPQRYIENVQAIVKYCYDNNEYRDIPWIVNTMGYNKGFGDELIGVICNFLNPTNVIQIESQLEINNFNILISKENVNSMEKNIIGDMYKPSQLIRTQHQLTLMNSVIPNNKRYQQEWNMNPRDIRLAMLISRLSMTLTGHAEWLTDIKPVCASIDDLTIINLGDDDVNAEDLLKTLVGNLVYLCQQESASLYECLGIGIVRGIDYPLKQIYLLPAVSLKVLEKVNCLAICGIPLPSSILINQGPKVKGEASYLYNTMDKTASMHIKQIYHRPQNFLTGRHRFVAE